MNGAEILADPWFCAISVLACLTLAVVAAARGAGQQWFLAAPLWLAAVSIVAPLIALPGVLAGTPVGRAGVSSEFPPSAAVQVLTLGAILGVGFTVGWFVAARKGFSLLPFDRATAPINLYLAGVLVILATTYFSALWASGINPLETLALATGKYGSLPPVRWGFVLWLAPLIFISLPLATVAVAVVSRRRSELWIGGLVTAAALAHNLLSGVRSSYLLLLLGTVLIAALIPLRHRDPTRRRTGLVAVALAGTLLLAGSVPLMTLVSNVRVGWSSFAFESGYTTFTKMPRGKQAPFGPAYERLETLALPFEVLPSSSAMMNWLESNSLPFAVSVTDALNTAVPRFIDGSSERPVFLRAVDGASGSTAGTAVDSAVELYSNVGLPLGAAVSLALGLGVGFIQRRASLGGSAAALLCSVIVPLVVVQSFSRGYLFQTITFTTSMFAGALVLAVIATVRTTRVRG